MFIMRPTRDDTQHLLRRYFGYVDLRRTGGCVNPHTMDAWPKSNITGQVAIKTLGGLTRALSEPGNRTGQQTESRTHRGRARRVGMKGTLWDL